jgi:DNA invertase Pin-like site-specific DNA recombinase
MSLDQLLTLMSVDSSGSLIPIIALLSIGLMMVSEYTDKSESSNNKEGGNNTCRGIIYTRVSSTAQAEKGNSLENQKENLREVAEDMDINVEGPIVDGGETGQNWDRKGIKILKYMAENQKISHLLVDDIDRLGRSAIQTLYFIWRLRHDYDITIITQSGRELDASNMTDTITLAMKSLMAELETDNQSRRANSARRKRIEEEQDWLSWFKEVPIGYQLRDDDWIEPNRDELEAVEALFSKFIEVEVTGAYTQTAEYLNNNHSEVLDEEISGPKVKRLLERPLYVGEPTPTLKGEDIPIEDDNLQLIDEQTRNDALDKIDKIYQRNSSDGHNADDLEDLADRYGVFEVYNSSSKIIQLCDSCGQASLTRSGTTTIDNASRRTQQYRCKDCGSTQVLPTKEELEKMKNIRKEFRDSE